MNTETDLQQAEIVEFPLLNLQDRCDRCGAQAFLRFFKPGSGELLMCGHDGSVMELDLMSQGFTAVTDQRSMINEKPGSGEPEVRPTGAYGLSPND